MADNDYERLEQALTDAEHAVETAYYDAIDPDIEVLIDDAREKLAEAKVLARGRA